MKFLVDAQLPKRLCQLLVLLGFDCIHTLDLPQSNKTTDRYIIEIAKKENRIIISKDKDFLQSYLLLKSPEKLLLITTGNITNNQLLKLFEKHFNFIVSRFEEQNLIVIAKEEIIIHE